MTGFKELIIFGLKFSPMRKLLTLLLSVVVLQTCFAQYSGDPSPCDSVEVLDVGLNPFNTDELIVYVANHNNVEFFSYPSFKLVNTKGDTVGEENPNFFGISQTSAHHLASTLDSPLPGEVFNGTLLLYTFFYDSLNCSFPISEPLVPNTGCTEFYISTADYIDSIDQILTWTITDEQANIVATGMHDHTVPEITLYDTVCLGNGCYTLNISAETALAGNTDITLYYLGYWVTESRQMHTGSSELDLDFSVYYCDSMTAGVEEEIQMIEIKIGPNPTSDFLNVSWDKDTSFDTMELMDVSGRSLVTYPVNGRSALRLSMNRLPNGIYLLRLNDTDGNFITRKVVKHH